MYLPLEWVLAILLTPFLTWVIYKVWGLARIKYYLDKLPMPPTTPIIGHFHLVSKSSAAELFNLSSQLAKQFRIYVIWVFFIGAVNLLQPEDIEVVLSTKKHTKKSRIYDFLTHWLGTGLLTSSGSKWFFRRKIITPAFHFNILKDFILTFNEETEALVQEILRKTNNCEEEINISSLVTNFTLQTISETSMGHSISKDLKTESEYRKAIDTIGDILVTRIRKPLLIWEPIYFFTSLRTLEKKALKTLHTYSRKVISGREKTFSKNEAQKVLEANINDDSGLPRKKRLAMLDVLLCAKHSGEDIDNEGIREEVDTFMFEGHDTTSMAISFCLMLIANHKDIQDRLVEEINTILGQNKTPSFKELQDLEYMERVIKETLRMYPSVFFISRYLTDDAYFPSGYFVPKGTMTHIHIYSLHHNPNIYPDPEKFDPDRFLPEEVQKRHPFAYLPFSAGPRNCIGQRYAILELKSVLIGILRKFELEAVDTPKTVILNADLVLRSKNGIRLKFKLRN